MSHSQHSPAMCEAGDIIGSKCTNARDSTLTYVPAHLASTADALGSTRGLLTSIGVCCECREDLLENWLDVDNVVRS